MTKATKWLRTAIVTALSVTAGPLFAQPAGQWDFDAGNLDGTVGAALTYKDGLGGNTALNDEFGTTTSFAIPDIGGTPANVIKTPGSPSSGGYRIPVAVAPNGGSASGLVNQWTLVMDLLVPDLATVRGLMETDGGLISPDSDVQINTSGGIGANGAFAGSLTSNTWYRVAVVVDASNNLISKYVNGQLVGTQSATRTTPALDGNWALDPAAGAEMFNDNDGQVGVVYVNSMQLYGSVLSPGQVLGLAGPTAAGLPTVLPPVPPYLVSRNPGASATGVVPNVTIQAVLDQGSRIVTPSSVKLQVDGVEVLATISATAPFNISYPVPSLFSPLSVHTATVLYTDDVAGAQSFTWSFTVSSYQQISLPAPIAGTFENFDSIAQGSLPAGWSVTNATSVDIAGINFADLESDAYLDWVVITRTTAETWTSGAFPRRAALPTIVVNGAVLPTLFSGTFAYAESDQRGGQQVQVMFTKDFDLTGRNNVFLSFWSSYEQNQDSMGAVEYSIDGGANWLPALYMVNDRSDNSDIIRLPNGNVDAVATLTTNRADQAYGLAYGAFIGAPVSQALAPFISGRIDDDNIESKRVELIRLAQADNKATVRLRFTQTGTASWYWGIDNVGLYSINTPVITQQPAARKVSAGENASFSVVATINPPFTYQWSRNGTPLSGATEATLNLTNVDTVNAGEYKVIVTNSDGSTASQGAVLTVVTVPEITRQPVNVLVSSGKPGILSVANIGRPPFNYTWYKGVSVVPAQTAATLNLDPASAADAGDYQVVIGNVDGSVTSRVAQLSVYAGTINQDLVAHLKFDGDYNDASGRANNAAGVNNPAFINGPVGSGALHVETSLGVHTNYATLGNATDLDFGTTTDFTVSFWVKRYSSSGDAAILGNKDWDSGSTAGWVFATDSDARIQWNLAGTETGVNGNRKDFDSPGGVLSQPVWKHVTATFDRDGFATTYVNGEMQVNRSTPAVPFTTLSNSVNNVSTLAGKRTNIGQDGLGAYYNNLNADLDDVGIWRRLLTPEEVRGIYQAGVAGNDLQQASATAAPLSAIASTVNGSNLDMTWTAAPGVRMQGSPSLTTPDWQDVSGTTGAGAVSVPINPTGDRFFRLQKP